MASRPSPGGMADGVRVDTRKLWAGGLASAGVAALTALVGVLVARGVFDVPVLTPNGEGAWGDADTGWYAAAAAGAALLATAVLHVLIMFTPQPLQFFRWITFLVAVAVGAAPFTVDADLDSQLATALINLAVVVTIGMLMVGVGRSTVRTRDRSRDNIRSQPPW
jgi:Family of unknown function (DUF6069)